MDSFSAGVMRDRKQILVLGVFVLIPNSCWHLPLPPPQATTYYHYHNHWSQTLLNFLVSAPRYEFFHTGGDTKMNC